MRLDMLAPQMRFPLPSAATLISGLTADSRDVQPGYLFAALSGGRLDGQQFVDQALARGASAILSANNMRLDVPVVTSANPRLALAEMAGRFFEHQPDMVVCVTGTNGKTSVAGYVRQLWRALGHASAGLGTLGVEALGIAWPLAHTTPDPVTLHATLRDLAGHGVTHLVLEASSHGLAQYRLDGVRVAVAGFTNLTRDHLDYHAEEADYLAAKQRLFTEVLTDDGVAVISIADAAGKKIDEATRITGRRILTTGTAEADIYITAKAATAQGQMLSLAYQGKTFQFEVPLIGAFQTQNLEIALGMVLATGADIDALCAALSTLRGVRGRMQYIGRTATGAHVYIDYAHTPDALTQALDALRHHRLGGALHVVFGCGGDRDVGKRAQMGSIAATHAEHIYVTDDNPRSEDAAVIRAEIMTACPQAHNIAERGEAMAVAINAAQKDDIVLVAGKGHEQGQIVGATVLPFDDAAIAGQLIIDAGGEA